MSLYPKAAIRLLPESGTQPKITPRIVILHSAAGRGSLHGFFANSSNLESHFWVSGSGLVEQYMDTNRRADANLHANGYAVSIETESTVAATERWTDRQAAAIVALVDWLCTEHEIPRVQVARPDGAGIGWHIMFGAPGPWTPVSKSCPGPSRILQARDEIIPAVAAAANQPPEDIDMTKDELLAILNDPKGPVGLLAKDLAEVKRQLTVSDEGKGKTQRTVRHIVAADLNKP